MKYIFNGSMKSLFVFMLICNITIKRLVAASFKNHIKSYSSEEVYGAVKISRLVFKLVSPHNAKNLKLKPFYIRL